MKPILLAALLLIIPAIVSAQSGGGLRIPEAAARDALDGRNGAFAIIRCSTGETAEWNPQVAKARFPPCSTFKIWNALLAIETGLVSEAGDAFYKWDGVEREIAAWNRDLSFREAFQASCVPAFQDLARRIGSDRMDPWIRKIGYGDENTSAGLDVFWLPAPDRKTILISPREQAELLRQLATGKLPVAPASFATLKTLMEVKKTGKGILYGKTGSGSMAGEGYNLCSI